MEGQEIPPSERVHRREVLSNFTKEHLTLLWNSHDELVAEINSETGQDKYLLGGLAVAAYEKGLVPSDTEVYDFMPPPILGGSTQVENVTVMDFSVKLHIAGQLHDQVRRTPPGTTISGFEIS